MLNSQVRSLFNYALDNSEIAWWEWDFKNNIIYSKDLKTMIPGYEPEKLKDKGYAAYIDLIHPEDSKRAVKAMKDHVSGKSPIYQVYYRLLKTDRKYSWYMDRGCIIERGDDGSPLKLKGVILDLSETLRKKYKDETIAKLIRTKLPETDSLENILILCSSCNKIKISKSLWVNIDSSFMKEFFEKISHGICPCCIKSLYPDEYDGLTE